MEQRFNLLCWHQSPWWYFTVSTHLGIREDRDRQAGCRARDQGAALNTIAPGQRSRSKAPLTVPKGNSMTWCVG